MELNWIELNWIQALPPPFPASIPAAAPSTSQPCRLGRHTWRVFDGERRLRPTGHRALGIEATGCRPFLTPLHHRPTPVAPLGNAKSCTSSRGRLSATRLSLVGLRVRTKYGGPPSARPNSMQQNWHRETTTPRRFTKGAPLTRF